ncbi:MAG: VCBS repeat-containing protein, partial [Candidatus Hydrogenedentes bacterium]|nr:VCBS repeat-containing protein [Candidatus Hydrogenedentota bacterium]
MLVPMAAWARAGIAAALWAAGLGAAADAAGADTGAAAAQPWARHTIDASSQGADGVRPGDVNGDGWPDLVTGWEEGGVVRVYLHPAGDGAALRKPWPAVTVGRVASPEDAVFMDVDADGAVDVVSSCEGDTQCMFVHWAPRDPARYLTPDAWTTQPIPATAGRTMWMFAVPMQVDGAGGLDLVVGSKGEDGLVGWLQCPAVPRNLDDWALHPLRKAGWIMSLVEADMDGDGDSDVVASDRKGPDAGVFWLENPGANAAAVPWAEHAIGAAGQEIMFLDVADLNGDARRDVLAAVKPAEVAWFAGPDAAGEPWQARTIPVQATLGVGTAKSVRAGDLDRDGVLDLVYSCEHAHPPRRGVVWLRRGA